MHKSIRNLIENAVRSLQDDIDYSYAKDTDFNQSEKKAFTYVNTSPLVAQPGYRVNNTHNYMKLWSVEMAFVKMDDDSSSPDQYNEILDQMDTLVDRFINKLNFYEPLSGTFTLQNFNQQPAIKIFANPVTGYILTFQMLVSDDFQYCFDC